MKHRPTALFPLLLSLLLLLSACGAGPSRPEDSGTREPPQTEEPAAGETAEETLADLCGADWQDYLTETITMQMGNRMDKDPEVVYFPIADGAPLTDYAAIDETTAFEVDADGNIVILFPAGAVTDAAHGEQSFTVPRP